MALVKKKWGIDTKNYNEKLQKPNSKIIHELHIELDSIFDDETQATSQGLIKELENKVGGFVHIIDPDLSSVHCLFSHIVSERCEAAINYAKVIAGFTYQDGEQAKQGLL